MTEVLIIAGAVIFYLGVDSIVKGVSSIFNGQDDKKEDEKK